MLLHDQWRLTPQGQRVMLQILLRQFAQRAFLESRDIGVSGNTLNDLLERSRRRKENHG